MRNICPDGQRVLKRHFGCEHRMLVNRGKWRMQGLQLSMLRVMFTSARHISAASEVVRLLACSSPRCTPSSRATAYTLAHCSVTAHSHSSDACCVRAGVAAMRVGAQQSNGGLHGHKRPRPSARLATRAARVRATLQLITDASASSLIHIS